MLVKKMRENEKEKQRNRETEKEELRFHFLPACIPRDPVVYLARFSVFDWIFVSRGDLKIENILGDRGKPESVCGYSSI